MLLLFSGFFYAVVNFSEMRRLHQFPVDSLETELRQLDANLTMYEQNQTLPPGGSEELSDLRKQRQWISLESLRRTRHVDRLASYAAVFGALFFLLPWLWGLLGKLKDFLSPGMPIPKLDIHEAPPREEYVDEFDFDRRREGGFLTREAAIEWMLKDPLRKCDYCGGELHATVPSAGDALQLITFYKKVPEGARDLRVILGSLWYGKPASEIKCQSCQRVIQR